MMFGPSGWKCIHITTSRQTETTILRHTGHSFQTQNRADALAPGKQTVAHGAMDGLRGLRFRRRQAIEVRVDQLLLLGEVVAKVHAFSGR
jgi:hypothetical protein